MSAIIICIYYASLSSGIDGRGGVNTPRMDTILHVAISSVISFLFLFVVTKIMGKKQIAQLSFLDYVIGISLGSIAAEMATEQDRPFYHFLLAMAFYLVLDLVLTFLARKAIFLKKFIRGRPVILVEDGKINYKNLTRVKLDINDLLSMCRAKGFFDLRDVAYCIFETSGEMSVLPTARATNVKSSDLGIITPEPTLSKDVIADGKVIAPALSEVGKDIVWLREKVGDNAAVKTIALATYYQDRDELRIHYK